MDNASTHQPVLLEEALAALAVRVDGAYMDATYGRGGHAAALIEQLGDTGRLVCLDRDPAAVAAARVQFEGDGRVRIEQADFARLGEVAAREAPGGFDGILLDLGVSSPQLDDPDRGFSFGHDGPLDMRMDPSVGPSAAEWLATVEADELADVLYHLGEERFARRIARAIVRARSETAIETTGQLAAIVARAVPRHERDRHPATRSFQAIRSHINGELEALDAALTALPGALAPHGRAAVISFHSLEDRRVKRFFRDAAGRRAPVVRDAHGRVPPTEPAGATPTLKPVGRGIVPSAAEAEANPRARSARLRVAERLP